MAAEIPDQGASLQKTNSGSPYPIDVPHRTRLGDVLIHPQLFEQYPHMRDMRIEFERDTGQHYRAYFDPRKGGSIGIVTRPVEAANLDAMQANPHEASHGVVATKERSPVPIRLIRR
jgi:hypothetical protein